MADLEYEQVLLVIVDLLEFQQVFFKPPIYLLLKILKKVYKDRHMFLQVYLLRNGIFCSENIQLAGEIIILKGTVAPTYRIES